MTARFKVVSGSTTGHCCFDASVVDTVIEAMPENEHKPGAWTVCECFAVSDAERICARLNYADAEK